MEADCPPALKWFGRQKKESTLPDALGFPDKNASRDCKPQTELKFDRVQKKLWPLAWWGT